MRSLYVCYLSLADPLVDSQVLAYLQGLAQSGHTIHLLTFERQRLTHARRRALRRALRRHGVAWHGLRYHQRPSLLATGFDTLCGALLSAWLVRRHRLEVIHARSHVPAAMALVASLLTGRCFIFDVRGLWADEYVDTGRWRARGVAFRLTKRIERRALAQATGIVVLTERVRTALFGAAPPENVFVIPCCADVEAIRRQGPMRDASRRALGLGDRIVLAYVGKLGGWYMEREMVEFFTVARESIPQLHFLVITQSDRGVLDREIARWGIDARDYTVLRANHADLGVYLAAADAAIAFIKASPSKIASSPTKIAEYLAGGLPVIASAGVGDVDDLLASSKTGVSITDFSSSGYRAATEGLLSLVSDSDVRSRCVQTARERRSLAKVGLPGYEALYQLVSRDDRVRSVRERAR